MFKKTLFLALLCTMIGINALYTLQISSEQFVIPDCPWNLEERTHMVHVCNHILTFANQLHPLTPISSLDALHVFVLKVRSKLYEYHDTENATLVGEIACKIRITRLLHTTLPLNENL